MPVDDDSVMDADDDTVWEEETLAALDADRGDGPVWEPIEHRWGAEVLKPLPGAPRHWAELWQSNPSAGGVWVCVVATSRNTEWGPEAVKAAEREFTSEGEAKAWAEGWVVPVGAALPLLPDAPP